MAVVLDGWAYFATGLVVFSGVFSGLGLGLAGTGLEMMPAIRVTIDTRPEAGCDAGKCSFFTAGRRLRPLWGMRG